MIYNFSPIGAAFRGISLSVDFTGENSHRCPRKGTRHPAKHVPLTEGRDPTTVVSSLCPFVFMRRTQKPLSSL